MLSDSQREEMLSILRKINKNTLFDKRKANAIINKIEKCVKEQKPEEQTNTRLNRKSGITILNNKSPSLSVVLTPEMSAKGDEITQKINNSRVKHV